MSNQNVFLVQSRNIKFLFSKIRSVDTSHKDFAFYAMRLMKLIAEDGIALLGGEGMTHNYESLLRLRHFLETEITTPCGTWSGIDIKEEDACAVSIIRAGDSMLEVRILRVEALPWSPQLSILVTIKFHTKLKFSF